MTHTPAHEVAPVMLGWVLESSVGGRRTALELTELEAYDQSEPAAHTHRGRTSRTASMFEQAGTLYVYRSYGLHWCANVVTGPAGHGSAVLLRAGAPVQGAHLMARRRGRSAPLAGGPGMLTQALGIEGAHDGIDLFAGGQIRLLPRPSRRPHLVTPRIGISKAVDLPWRFVDVSPRED